MELPQVTVFPAAHVPEHSLEVELPFLQTVLGEFALVPLLVGESGPDEVADVIAAVWREEDTLVVVSSDLSHYLEYAEARRLDQATAQQIVDLRWPVATRQACGAQPVSGLLREAERRGIAARVLDLRSSGDTAGGRAQVVGYGAFGFYRAA
jgi:AmmeMemoRadiSam system protein B